MSKAKKRMVRFRIGEISGVDVPAQTPAEALIVKNKKPMIVRKSFEDFKREELIKKGAKVFLTGMNNGHQHKIYVYVSSDLDYVDVYCSYAGKSGSYEDYHGHDIMWDEKANSYVMVNDSGHIHDFDSEDIMKYVEELKAERKAEAKTILEKNDMKFEILKNLSVEDFEYIKTLSEDDAIAFIEKSASEREKVRKAHEALDPVEYVTADGVELRKSAGQKMIDFAKQADENAKELAKQREVNANLEYAKKVSAEIAHLPGTEEIKIDLYKAAEKIGEDALNILRSKDKETAKKFETVGEGEQKVEKNISDNDAETALNDLDEAVKKYAAEHKVSEAVAYNNVLSTEMGRELYKRAYASN